jgi:hypothetical protein
MIEHEDGPGRRMAGTLAFDTLAGQLRERIVTLNEPPHEARATGYTAELRARLRKDGPSSAAQLGVACGLPSSRVGALLARDVLAGRVLVRRAGGPSRAIIYTLPAGGRP